MLTIGSNIFFQMSNSSLTIFRLAKKSNLKGKRSFPTTFTNLRQTLISDQNCSQKISLMSFPSVLFSNHEKRKLLLRSPKNHWIILSIKTFDNKLVYKWHIVMNVASFTEFCKVAEKVSSQVMRSKVREASKI